VSSNDPSRSNRKAKAPQAGEPESGNTSRSSEFFDIDPAEIDRYLGGREPRSQGRNRPRSGSSGTARQLEQLQQSVNRASRGRRRPEPPPIESPEYDNDEPESAEPTGYYGNQTSYAAEPETPRANRRKRVKWRDPYVDSQDYAEDDLDSGFPGDPQASSSYLDEPPYRERDLFDSEVDESWEDEPAPRPARRRTAQSARPGMPRPNIQRPALPAAITRADLANDATALAFIGLSCLSLLLMTIVVANRIGALNPVISTHISASGIPGGFASRTTIWHLPLLAAMLTLMNLVAAWFISPLDRFASRFLLAASVVVQFVVWVALLRILW